MGREVQPNDLSFQYFRSLGLCDLSVCVLCHQSIAEQLDDCLGAATKAQYQMQRGFFLDVVVRQCSPVLQLLAGKDETLLIRWDTFFVLDLLLDVFDRVTGFDVKRDGLPGQSFYENLHGATEACVCVCVCKSLGLMFV